MKAKEDPRSRRADYSVSRDCESEEEEEEESWYDSEESSSESCPSSSKEHYDEGQVEKQNNNVLVVAGCKGCLMYFMVPKQVEDCPKCTGQLLHFDRSENGSPWLIPTPLFSLCFLLRFSFLFAVTVKLNYSSLFFCLLFFPWNFQLRDPSSHFDFQTSFSLNYCY